MTRGDHKEEKDAKSKKQSNLDVNAVTIEYVTIKAVVVPHLLHLFILKVFLEMPIRSHTHHYQSIENIWRIANYLEALESASKSIQIVNE